MIKTKVYKGRIVSTSTHWYAMSTSYPKSSLYCIHGKKLSRECGECPND